MSPRGSFHLLVAADGTPATDAAARAVRELFDHSVIRRVTVVAVGDPFACGINGCVLALLGLAGTTPQPLVDDLRARATTHAAAEVERVVRLIGNAAARIDSLARIGDPVSEIVTAARELGADLIVVGSSREAAGHRDLASELMRRAQCPVLVIRPVTAVPPANGKRLPASGISRSRLAPAAMPAAAWS